ncbi:MAG: hypothetical protein IK136_03475 [Oscillospiraceae bacterium]|nr:hypothetical protein [Oscillospiraceae bacterium]
MENGEKIVHNTHKYFDNKWKRRWEASPTTAFFDGKTAALCPHMTKAPDERFVGRSEYSPLVYGLFSFAVFMHILGEPRDVQPEIAAVGVDNVLFQAEKQRGEYDHRGEDYADEGGQYGAQRADVPVGARR